ncbi:hypothetical protein L915_07412, partial [Phytophthora nicotianae]
IVKFTGHVHYAKGEFVGAQQWVEMTALSKA